MEVYLMHHGIKGQQWGVRRYQNPDGTLTEAGRKRYSTTISNKTYTNYAKAQDFAVKVKENGELYKDYLNSDSWALRRFGKKEQKEHDKLAGLQKRYEDKMKKGLQSAGYDDFVKQSYMDIGNGKTMARTLLRNDFGDLTITGVTFSRSRKVTDRMDITVKQSAVEEAKSLVKERNKKATEYASQIVDDMYSDKDLQSWVDEGSFDTKKEAKNFLTEMTAEDLKSGFYSSNEESTRVARKAQEQFTSWMKSRDSSYQAAFALEDSLAKYGIDIFEEGKR